MDEHLPALMSAVQKCLVDKNQALKLDALIFVRNVLDHHRPEVMQVFMPQLLPLVLAIVKEEWYKIIAQALRVVAAIIQVCDAFICDIKENLFLFYCLVNSE